MLHGTCGGTRRTCHSYTQMHADDLWFLIRVHLRVSVLLGLAAYREGQLFFRSAYPNGVVQNAVVARQAHFVIMDGH